MNSITLIKKLIIVILIITVTSFIIYKKNKPSPTEINRQTLAQVKLTPTWYAPYHKKVDVPSFSDYLKKLNGQIVEITGFYIPMAMNSDKCALSKNPNSACFFCGGSTVETIMMVNFSNRMMNFPDDAVITLEGKLLLDTTFNEFFYTLKDAGYVRSNK